MLVYVTHVSDLISEGYLSFIKGSSPSKSFSKSASRYVSVL
jgi:hypothetical protein